MISFFVLSIQEVPEEAFVRKEKVSAQSNSFSIIFAAHI